MLRREDRGEVEERAGRGRHRDTSVHGDLVARELRAVDLEPVARLDPAAVQAMQTAVGQPVLNRPRGEAESGELTVRDDTVLRPGECGDRRVEPMRSTFWTIIG
jgi:hypothetical protein